jgi:hypothetical protein
MKLTIGSTTIDITKCEKMRNHKKGFFLDIVVPQNSIGMDALYALLNGTTKDIVVITDDGVENTYKGFKEVGAFTLENGEYHVWQVATSELEAQNSILQNKVAEQNTVIANLQSTIEAQAEVIDYLIML